MSVDQVLIGLIGIACGGIGWFAQQLYQAVNKLKDDLDKLEVRMGTDYVRYDRLQDALRPLKESLDKIESALTHKADKP